MIFPRSVYDNKYITREFTITGKINGQVVHLTIQADNVMDAIHSIQRQNPEFELVHVQVIK